MEYINWLNGKLGTDIYESKYQSGSDVDLDAFFTRVSNGNKKVKDLIVNKQFIFGGRILANRGLKDRKLTLSNCYVIAPPEDNIESIFECASKLARTFSYGGGCGIDISNLRPRGASTSNAAKESSGAVSFMDIMSTVTGTIAQNGRRGALMISMDVNHPDIQEFIDCKTDLKRVQFANISVRVNNDFMKAVENDDDYILRWPCDTQFVWYNEPIEYNKLYKAIDDRGQLSCYYKKVKAKELFNKLAYNNWDYAEPGILYWDNITQHNMLNNNPNFKYAGTNPCAEEPLSAGGSCLLGSLVLSGFVENPFTHKAHFNFDKFEEAVCVAVAALNQVLLEGEKLHPLREQRESVYDWKQIGLGTMGLADMFIRLGIKYDSDEAIDLTKTIFKQLATSAVLASLEMAKVEGCFPKCNCQEIAHSEFINALELPSETIKQIEEYGLFNSQLLTCAPTGSIGNLIGTSTGVEPYYQFSYLRNTKSLKNEDTLYEVKEKIVTEYENATGLSYKDNPIFVSSQDIDPFKRLEIQAAMQQYVDAAISSTLNLNENVSVETVANLYKEAWKKGLKGITIFRNNCKRQAILFTSAPKEQKRELDKLVPLKRDEFGTELSGTSYQRKTACGKLYITVNKDKDDNLVELFTNSSKNGTCKANLNAETRLISLCFRLGAKVSEVFDALSHIQCQSCAFARAKGQQIDGTSCPDIIAKVIMSEYLKTHTQDNNDNDMKECPHCHKKSLRLEGGCCTCVECGWSKCDN